MAVSYPRDMTVIDVTEATFQAEVVERSRTVPVVVDFWAEWCGPCRALGPILEKETAKHNGDVVLAKVDTDANPQISQAFEIQGIPAVKAFKDGKVVDEFVGVQNPAQVERFFRGLVPSEADGLVAVRRRGGPAPGAGARAEPRRRGAAAGRAAAPPRRRRGGPGGAGAGRRQLRGRWSCGAHPRWSRIRAGWSWTPLAFAR